MRKKYHHFSEDFFGCLHYLLTAWNGYCSEKLTVNHSQEVTCFTFIETEVLLCVCRSSHCEFMYKQQQYQSSINSVHKNFSVMFQLFKLANIRMQSNVKIQCTTYNILLCSVYLTLLYILIMAIIKSRNVQLMCLKTQVVLACYCYEGRSPSTLCFLIIACFTSRTGMSILMLLLLLMKICHTFYKCPSTAPIISQIVAL